MSSLPNSVSSHGLPRNSTEFISHDNLRILVRACVLDDDSLGVEIATSDADDHEPDEYIRTQLTVAEANALAVAIYKSACVAEEDMSK